MNLLSIDKLSPPYIELKVLNYSKCFFFPAYFLAITFLTLYQIVRNSGFLHLHVTYLSDVNSSIYA